MSKIQIDFNAANGVAINVANDVLPFWLMEVSPFCFYESKSLLHAEKICYDKAGNLPNKGRNFNTQTWGKIVYFLFV